MNLDVSMDSISHMKTLLFQLKQSKGEDTLETLRIITDQLTNSPEMREHFFRLNALPRIIDCFSGADIQTLNSALALLTASTYDHGGNKAELTTQKIFGIINKILEQTKSNTMPASSRAMFLLSYIVEENSHGQDLANLSGCIKSMEELFRNLAPALLNTAHANRRNFLFAWHSLCSAISTCCVDPLNEKNQNSFQSIIPEAVMFLQNWIRNASIKIHLADCVKDLLAMLPLVLLKNSSNQFSFIASSGLHIVIKGLISMEKWRSAPCDLTDILAKLIHLLHIALMGNPQTVKLAGSLGAVTVLLRLLKQFTTKDKETAVLCLATLLESKENEEIFEKIDGYSIVRSQVKTFDENSRLGRVLERICHPSKLSKQSSLSKSQPNLLSVTYPDTSPPSNKQNSHATRFSPEGFYNPTQMFAKLDLETTGNAPMFSKPLEDDGDVTDTADMGEVCNEHYIRKSRGPVLFPGNNVPQENKSRLMQSENTPNSINFRSSTCGPNKNNLTLSQKNGVSRNYIESSDEEQNLPSTKYSQVPFFKENNEVRKRKEYALPRNMLREETRIPNKTYPKVTALEEIYGQREFSIEYETPRHFRDGRREDQSLGRYDQRRSNYFPRSGSQRTGIGQTMGRSNEARRENGYAGRGDRSLSAGRRGKGFFPGRHQSNQTWSNSRNSSSEMPDLGNTLDDSTNNSYPKDKEPHHERYEKHNETKVHEARKHDPTPQQAFVPFSEDEEKNLVAGLKKYGLDFKTIYQTYDKWQTQRTPNDLYQQWRNCYLNPDTK